MSLAQFGPQHPEGVGFFVSIFFLFHKWQKKTIQEMTSPPPPVPDPCSSFISIATAVDGSGHSIGVTSQGWAYSWNTTHRKNGTSLGQLGRDGNPRMARLIHVQEDDNNNTTGDYVKFQRAYAGGTSDAGHSALLDRQGRLWVFGCDRWQQLGLGSSNAGAVGYTWTALWQEKPKRNDFFFRNVLEKNDSKGKVNIIRDVALGGDHTLILSSNRKDVISFGKGAEGQLGLGSYKPFVSAAAKAKDLCENSSSSSSRRMIAAVCAIRHCSLTLDDNGNVLKKVGKCRDIQKGLEACRRRARDSGLLVCESNK